MVRTSEAFLTDLDRHFGEHRSPTTQEVLLTEVIPYIFSAFEQLWDDLPHVAPGNSRSRLYFFAGDNIPAGFVVGNLVEVKVEDRYILMVIELTNIQIDFGDAR